MTIQECVSAEGTISGFEFYPTDGEARPTKCTPLKETQVEDWFFSHSEASIKILAIALDTPRRDFKVLFCEEIVEHAIWRPAVYHHLTSSRGGGAAGLIDEPPRFILQTPTDDEPFCSLAMSKRGTMVKGVYTYSDAIFEPTSVFKGEVSPSSWKRSGLQIVNLPQAILRRHSSYISAQISGLCDDLEAVEEALVQSSPIDFASLTRTLHTCSARLIALQRRARFEATLISAIETVVSRSQHGQLPWTAIALQKAGLEARALDFEDLPRRIENARATISGLVQQRNEQMSLEIAEASKRMAAFALSDNASMKTIAIVAMIFLPGTAVASFFSMSMFDWSASSGDGIASKWLWVFFVVAVPLSVAVIAVWWVWTRTLQRRLARSNWIESVPRRFESEDVELQTQEYVRVAIK